MADRMAAYEVLREIGYGSLDNVYKAFCKETGEIVALKVLNVDSHSMELLQADLERLKEAKYSRITQFYESFFHEGRFYIVSEYVEGCSVKEILEARGGLSEMYIAILLKELLLALSFLHDSNRFHGEVRAANLLLSMSGLVKLADFGASKPVSEAAACRMALMKEPYWTAPEVLLSSVFDTKIDIWSVGITAIELARCESPYRRLQPMQAILQLQSGAPPTLDNSFSQSFIDFVGNCLQKSADQRPDAEALLNHRFIRSAKRCHVLTDLLDLSSKQAPRADIHVQHTRSASMNTNFNRVSSQAPMHRNTLSTGSQHMVSPPARLSIPGTGSFGSSPSNSATNSMRASIVISADATNSAPQSPTRHIRFGSGEFFVVEEPKPKRQKSSEKSFLSRKV